jgi:hypothetical protein
MNSGIAAFHHLLLISAWLLCANRSDDVAEQGTRQTVLS